jgi:hypothetical protein
MDGCKMHNVRALVTRSRENFLLRYEIPRVHEMLSAAHMFGSAVLQASSAGPTKRASRVQQLRTAHSNVPANDQDM